MHILLLRSSMRIFHKFPASFFPFPCFHHFLKETRFHFFFIERHDSKKILLFCSRIYVIITIVLVSLGVYCFGSCLENCILHAKYDVVFTSMLSVNRNGEGVDNIVTHTRFKMASTGLKIAYIITLSLVSNLKRKSQIQFLSRCTLVQKQIQRACHQ